MFKNTHIWLPDYLRSGRKPRAAQGGTVHVMFCIADHFEPRWKNPPYEQEVARLERWRTRFGAIAARHHDSDGCSPRDTLFFPAEEYRPEHLNTLAECRDRGFADVEIHLHHDHDTAESLTHTLEEFKVRLVSHGLLSRPKSRPDVVAYAFVHGNWALDNSRPDGRWCGVNNELQVLRDTGCYADFTLPSAPSETQTRKINSIYYATDDPAKPKSHDAGVDVEVGKPSSGDLLMVQGPLALNWRRRKWAVLPRIENADLCHTSLPTADRIDLWMSRHVHVKGRPEWVFVKISTHSLQERNLQLLDDGSWERMFSYLERTYNDGERYRLHYVTARETYNIIKAAEAGCEGNPHGYRDYVLVPGGASRCSEVAS